MCDDTDPLTPLFAAASLFTCQASRLNSSAPQSNKYQNQNSRNLLLTTWSSDRRSGHRTIAPDCPSQSTSRSGSVSLQQIRQWQSANNAIPSLVQQAPLTANDNSFSTSSHNRTAHFLGSLEQSDIAAQIPPFIRPPPFQIAAEDVSYLNIKSALTLPSIELQNALLQAYIEYVHPYMPLMDIHEFLNIVTRRDGLNGQTSLFLYQAVMFSASAFVDMKYLREAGYLTRKAARKSFFQRTRVCPGCLASP